MESNKIVNCGLLIDKKHYEEVIELGFNSKEKYIKLKLAQENKLFESFNDIDMDLCYLDKDNVVVLIKKFKKSKFVKEKSDSLNYYYSFEDYELINNPE